jgi:hypothetical protein
MGRKQSCRIKSLIFWGNLDSFVFPFDSPNNTPQLHFRNTFFRYLTFVIICCAATLEEREVRRIQKFLVAASPIEKKNQFSASPKPFGEEN